MNYPWDVVLVIGWLAIWLLFPIGLFISQARLDRDSDQSFQFHKAHSPVVIKSFHKVKDRAGFRGKHWDFTFGRGVRT